MKVGDTAQYKGATVTVTSVNEHGIDVAWLAVGEGANVRAERAARLVEIGPGELGDNPVPALPGADKIARLQAQAAEGREGAKRALADIERKRAGG